MTAATEVGSRYTRLHITPLDAALLPTVLSGSLLPKARHVSYHQIATFPERRYGFVDLPTEDAVKLRKKLNGAVLKGQKTRVEEAKPEQRPEPLGEAAMSGDKVHKKKERNGVKEDKLKKRKRQSEEIPGIELENGRKVKRGWTVADEPKSYKDKEKRKKEKKEKKDKKQRREVKSKYTEHPECLIKAVLPTKVVEPAETDEDGKRKRRKSKTKEVVVHEFAKTTKFPTFLKSSVSASSMQRTGDIEFVDGTGWVDEMGNVVEAVKTRSSPVASTNASLEAKLDAHHAPEVRVDLHEAIDKEGDSKSVEEIVGGAATEDAESIASITAQEGFSKPKAISTPTSILKKSSTRPPATSPAKGLSINIPPVTPGGAKVHPLEALYKRPLHGDGAAETAASEPAPFSFFGDGDAQDDTWTATLQVPLTPFSRQDFESRGIRSTAPTPDTAHPSRMARFWPDAGTDDIAEENDDEADEDGAGVMDTNFPDDEEEHDQSMQDAEADDKQAADPASDFQKWFWEHRGDLNRSWKKRRKAAAKEKRYRENRARAERAI